MHLNRNPDERCSLTELHCNTSTSMTTVCKQLLYHCNFSQFILHYVQIILLKLYTVCTHSNKSVCYSVCSGNVLRMQETEEWCMLNEKTAEEADWFHLIWIHWIGWWSMSSVTHRWGARDLMSDELKKEVQAKTSLTVKLPNTNPARPLPHWSTTAWFERTFLLLSH